MTQAMHRTDAVAHRSDDQGGGAMAAADCRPTSAVLANIRGLLSYAADRVYELGLEEKVWTREVDLLVARIAGEAYTLAGALTAPQLGPALGVTPVVRVRELASAHGRLLRLLSDVDQREASGTSFRAAALAARSGS